MLREDSPRLVRQLKAWAERDITVGGSELAAQAITCFVAPIVVGTGKHWLPHGVSAELELLDERRFVNGTAHLQYCTRE